MLTGEANFVWGDTVIVDGTTIATGWNNGGALGKTCSQTSSTGVTFLTTTQGQLTAQGNYSWHSIHSSDRITLTSGQTIKLELKGLTSSAKYELSYSTDGNTFNNVKSTIGKTDEFTEYEIDGVAGEYYLYLWTYAINIKSIIIKAPVSGTTPQPTSFTKSSVTHNSVSLGWTAGGVEENWQIKYNAGSDFNPASEGSIAADDPIESNSYVLSGLNELTTYYVYVRAYIDESTQSGWTGPLIFTTPEQYPTPTGLTASNLAGSGTEATLSWTNGVGTAASKWQIRYSTSSTFNPEEAEVTLVNNVSTNPYTLTGLTANTTYYACIRADYSDNTENHYSDWTDTISFTPIEAWEDFSNGIPETWYNNGFVTNRSGYEGQAFSSSSSNELRTPRLYANKDDQLNFYVTLGGGNLTARYYKNSRSSYTTISSYSTGGEKTFTAPSDGYYWIVFTGAYNGAVDNISGFSIADTENLMELGSKTMSTTGTVGGDYTASVVLRELGGNNENYTAQLYYDEEVVAEKVGETINGNRDETVSLTFTPSVAKTSKPMYIKIIYNNGESVLTTASTNVTMSNTTIIFDEKGTTDNKPDSYGTIKVLLIKYVAQTGWNTICVPFVLNDTYLTQIFGSNYRVYKINSFSGNGLSFSKTTSYSVSTPYLIYAPNTTEVAESINLKDVYYNPTNLTSENRIQTKGTGTTASFIGTFAPKAAPDMEGKYGVTTEGKLGKGNSSASIKGYRAYVEVSDPSLSRLSIIIDDDEENQTTDLGFVKLIDKDAKDVFNLQGQKVKKATKGIYIVNGRKVIIK